MSITFNSHTSASGSGATLTFSHTVDAGDDRVLLVGVSMVTDGIGTVTFDAEPLTQEIEQDPGGGGTRPWSSAYSLIAPPVGTFDVAVPHTAGSSGFRRRVAGAITAYGVDQETPFRGWVGQGIESGTSLSVSPDSAAGDKIIDVVGAEIGTATPGTGQSQLWNDTESIVRGTASTKDGEAVSTEMSWTVESGRNSMVASAIVPADDEPGDTFTAAVSLTASRQQLEASAEHEAPDFETEVSLSASPQQMAAGVATDDPEFTAAASLVASSQTVQVSAEHDAPELTAVVDLAASSQQIEVAVLTGEPEFTAAVSLIATPQQIAAAASAGIPDVEAAVLLVASPQQLSADAFEAVPFRPSQIIVLPPH